MRIVIDFIAHKHQRYPTVGDFFNDGDTLKIFVSKTRDWRYSFLVAVHELIEAGLCKHAGIDYKAIDRFDMAYEKKRKKGDHSEPGDHPKAPYRQQHAVATDIERYLATMLKVNWQKYEAALNKL